MSTTSAGASRVAPGRLHARCSAAFRSRHSRRATTTTTCSAPPIASTTSATTANAANPAIFQSAAAVAALTTATTSTWTMLTASAAAACSRNSAAATRDAPAGAQAWATQADTPIPAAAAAPCAPAAQGPMTTVAAEQPLQPYRPMGLREASEQPGPPPQPHTKHPHESAHQAPMGRHSHHSRRAVLLAGVTVAATAAAGLVGLPLGHRAVPLGRALASEHGVTQAAELEAEAFAYVEANPGADGAAGGRNSSGGGRGGGAGGTGATTGEAPATRPATRMRFGSISEAVAACPEGGVVLVAAGRYRERLVLSRPVAVRAWPPGALVELVWETQEPYQSTVEIGVGASGGGREVELRGLTIHHASKSVANNYGVYIKSGAPRLEDCDISSATGAGVGVEGASPQLLGCRIHDCARQGIAIFGSPPTDLDLGLDPAVDPGLMYGMTGGVVQECDVCGNALDGILVRSGASPDILDNRIHNNGGVGVNLQDCAGRYERNAVYDNARGALAVSPLFELDPGDLAGSNALRGLLRRL